MKKTFPLLFVLILLLAFFVPVLVTAQEKVSYIVPCGHSGLPECTRCHFFYMLQNIYNFLVFKAAPILGGLFIVIGGVMFLTAGGSEQRIAQAKKIMTSIVIGLVIVYASWLLINTIFNLFVSENIPGFERDTWYQFHCVPSE